MAPIYYRLHRFSAGLRHPARRVVCYLRFTLSLSRCSRQLLASRGLDISTMRSQLGAQIRRRDRSGHADGPSSTGRAPGFDEMVVRMRGQGALYRGPWTSTKGRTVIEILGKRHKTGRRPSKSCAQAAP